jgi:V8-like Glu-specific endopeptidase
MTISDYQYKETLFRWNKRESIRKRNIELISKGKYLDADSKERVQKFLSRRGYTEEEATEIITSKEKMATLGLERPGVGMYLSLERVLGEDDLVDVSFFQLGLAVSNTIGKVWVFSDAGNLKGYGTGFMISPHLMITNNHVLPDISYAKNSKIEFNYQLDIQNNLLKSEIFRLDSVSFYHTSKELDFTIVSVLPESSDRVPISNFGWNKLSKEVGKTIVSQWLNIIQHPKGMPKRVSVRENQLIDVLDNFLQYKTDTAPGSSGSPVFNERWEVVGVHHSGVWATDSKGNKLDRNGGIWNNSMSDDDIKWIANEGVRISSILKNLDEGKFDSNKLKLVDEIYSTSECLIKPKQNIMEKEDINRVSATNQDGSVTFNVPLSITVKIGGTNLTVGSNIVEQSRTVTNVISEDKKDDKTKNDEEILEQAKKELGSKDGVLNVRMGYVFENGWITKERAVVITVLKRKSDQDLKKECISPLPKKFMGYKVEVTGPTFEELIKHHLGSEKYESYDEIMEEEITYVPPEDGKLETVEAKMKVNAHVSPEEGWKNLEPFLLNTKNKLIVAMYDFGAKHILKAIEKASSNKAFQEMKLAIQPGESLSTGTKKNDLKDEEVVDELGKKLKKKFGNAWVSVGSKKGWVTTSYHIKVAVRDSSAIWLSSGNWQSSNQPDLDELKKTNSYMLTHYNRDWHIIVENKELAKTFEKFILNDYEHNKDNELGKKKSEDEEMSFLVPDTDEAISEEATKKEYSTFIPFSEDRVFKVTPILTPDNFYDEVIKLVESAEKELLIQNQTFNAPNENQEKLEKLISLVLDKQKAGIDVKIIFRNIGGAKVRENLEKLVDMGFDECKIKIQKDCHTKAVMVDGERVMIGSQNWSELGITFNRDASLLFYDEKLTKYYREIFIHDWENLAKQDIGNESVSTEITTDTKNIPSGMKLLSWKEVKETL